MSIGGYGQQSQYRKTQIDTASPEDLVLMLYDGALRFLGHALDAFGRDDHEQVNNNLVRVQAIIGELLATLDHDRGGEIAKNLARLYLFFLDRLADANVRKDPAPAQAVKPLLEDLRNTWVEAMKKHVQSGPNSGPGKPAKLNLAV